MSALALLIFCAQDLSNESALETLNRSLSRSWNDHGRRTAKTKATEALLDWSDKTPGVWIRGRESGVRIQLTSSPGFSYCDRDGLRVEAPLQGGWEDTNWSFAMDLRIDIPGFGWENVTVRVRDIKVVAEVEIDSSDPDRPRVRRAEVLPPSMNVSVDFENWGLDLLSAFVLSFVDLTVRKAARLVAEVGLQQLNATALAGLPNPYNPTPEMPPAVPDRFDFESPAHRIERNLFDHHVPELLANHPGYGTLLSARFDVAGDESLTWLAFSAPGTVIGYEGWADSGIWTGHALTALSLHYRLTGGAAPKRTIERLLRGLHILTEMKSLGSVPGGDGWPLGTRVRGVSAGLLCRAVRPESHAPSEREIERYGWRLLEYRGGRYWVDDHISRDQYLGVMMGLGAAYDFVPDARERTKVIVRRILDYLLENRWSAYDLEGNVTVSWHPHFAQQLAFLAIGRRVDPERYDEACREHLPLVDLAWLAPWADTMDTVKNEYFKFNLDTGALWTYLRLETNPEAWTKGYRAFRILRKALSNHQNAYFNLCHVWLAPGRAWATARLPWKSASAVTVGEESRRLLRLWLQRPRRQIGRDLTSEVPTFCYVPPLSQLLAVDPVEGDTSGADQAASGIFAVQPVRVDRRPCTDFLWQRSPFQLSSGGDGTLEAPGVDYLLPYWMGRWCRVFAAGGGR